METKVIGPDVWVTTDKIPNLTSADIGGFATGVEKTARQRVRLCTHQSIEDRLHEMFVAYVKATYVRPNKHIGKDESLHILEGRADFVFFDDTGRLIDVVPLGAYDSGHAFYCRIPQGVYHTWVIHSDVIVVHETTPGPFDRKDTIFAPWAPEEGSAEVGTFMAKLASDAERLLASGSVRG